MAKELGGFTPSPTGTKQIVLSSVVGPKFIKFWVGPRTGTTETANMSSFGYVDVTNDVATWQSNFTDGSGSQTKNGVSSATGGSALQHYRRDGSIAKKIDFAFVETDDDILELNITTADVDSTVYFEAEE